MFLDVTRNTVNRLVATAWLLLTPAMVGSKGTIKIPPPTPKKLETRPTALPNKRQDINSNEIIFRGLVDGFGLEKPPPSFGLPL
tara:strand:- start:4 stop:255 length:252 start_codon:yes stop_codon:yes gene_type:complete